MNSSFIRRFMSYFADVMIVGVVLSIVSIFLTTDNAYKLNREYKNTNEEMLNEKIDVGTYYNRVADLSLSLDKENLLINIINCVIIIAYFVILPLYKNGQTIGKKAFGIKIVRDDNEELTANELIIRNVIVNGLLNTLLSFCLVFFLPGFEYFTIISILALIQYILILISGLMIIFRNDKRGLHDIITKTHVILDKMEVEYERV
ncbi:MAG: RDD family protein [Clostridium sp.]|nr:RDD family protein [Clostridium sp.]MCM1444745.1 RDD family protein [Candidatus Amulumruptor caecigallinarius]